RSPEYVDRVIKTYKNALGCVEDGSYSLEKVKQWNKDLKTVFNRGFTQNFYMGEPISAWAGIHGSKSTEEKTFVGKVLHYYPEPKVAEVIIQGDQEIEIGEQFSITGKTTGIIREKIEELRVDDKTVENAKQGDVFTLPVSKKVRKNDSFFVIRDRKSKIPRGREKFYKK
ncbi:U32 family peptidase, partial [Candidatus Dojkabacteria bacterium]|nr:U32 family peptidase [Candidatus Dojkabacteria bacterium]